jgi:hypothetical protein
MAIADAPVTHDFWAVAPDLGARANSIQESLERADSVGPVAREVAALANALPKLADDYAEADPYLTGPSTVSSPSEDG